MLPAILLAVLPLHPVNRAEALFPRLGGPTYAGRERAGRELVALGRAALPALRRGQAHRDPEIAERCKRLIPLAEAEAVRQRVAFMLDTPPKPVPDDVPRARRFLAATGDTREARERYVEMYMVHAALLEEVDRAGEQAGAVFWQWVDREYGPEPGALEVVERTPQPRTVVCRADVALFWLLSADPALKPVKCRAVARPDFPVFTSEAAREAVSGPKASPALRRLLLAWLKGPRNFEWPGAEASRVQEGFKLAADAGFPEARPMALAVARDKDEWHVPRAAALMALIRIGQAGDLPALAPLVTDDTVLGAAHGTTTLGDVALAACVSLSGQAFAAYGFPHADAGQKAGATDPLHLGFASPADRAAARTRWAASNRPPGGAR